tara:strand:+ start:383 stop:493 length:111 start_codon:yes stop_codon:yes gene_type:complete
LEHKKDPDFEKEFDFMFVGATQTNIVGNLFIVGERE